VGDKTPKQLAKTQGQKRAASTQAAEPRGKRAVAAAPTAESSYSHDLRFMLGEVDLDGPWCLTRITAADHRELLAFMKEMESKPLREIIPVIGKSEDVAGASPNPDAQQRARDKYPDDHDYIHSLRLAGAKRLWGLLRGHEFSIIWWDPSHEVWPTKRVYQN